MQPAFRRKTCLKRKLKSALLCAEPNVTTHTYSVRGVIEVCVNNHKIGMNEKLEKQFHIEIQSQMSFREI